MIRLEKRLEPSRVMTAVTPVIAVVLTMIVGGIMFALLGKPPFEAIKMIFWEPIFGEFAFFYRSQILIKAAPLIIIATGLSFGFRAGIWNIGAEGQYIVGAICGAAAALAFYPLESRFIFLLMLAAGILGGFAWAMIPAVLKNRFKTNEILVSLMLVYVATSILTAVSQGILKNPDGHGFPGSRNLQQYPSAANLELIPNTGIHLGVIAALLFVVVTHFFMRAHILGFQVKITGEAPRAARFSGIAPDKIVYICLGISGASAGLAGVLEVAGPAGQITSSFHSGYGFTAIVVAYLGRLNALGILLSGLLLALTYIGGEIVQQELKIPSSSMQAFQGMMLFFLLATDLFITYRIRLGVKK